MTKISYNIMENIMNLLEEYRLLAIKDNIVIELEDGFLSESDAQLAIPYWKEKYQDYEIVAEKY